MTFKPVLPGHSACAGCGEIMGVRKVLEAIGKDVVVVQATGCMEITTTPYPKTAFAVPWIHVTFENAASVASGIREALHQKGNDHTTVVAMAGDGGMMDIGFRALSGALERGHDVLYVITDNECYANTGIQRSSGTPMFASTTTTPAGKVIHGKEEWKKNIVFIAAAHGIPYVASANVAFDADLKKKMEKVKSIKGPKVIHLMTPCPISWRHESDKTVNVGKLAVETGMWVLHEVENGVYRRTYKPKQLKPVEEYLKVQGRFKHVTKEDIKVVEEHLQRAWAELEKLEKSNVNLLNIL